MLQTKDNARPAVVRSPKIPRTNVHCLKPLPPSLNVQLTLRGKSENTGMLTAPNRSELWAAPGYYPL